MDTLHPASPGNEAPPRSLPQLLKWRIGPAIVILVLAGTASWVYFQPPPPAPGVLQVSGRVEGDIAALGSTSGGRVVRILPREGDRLEAGALIAQMQSEQRQAEFERAEHLLHTAREQIALARDRVASLRRELEAAQLAVTQAGENSLAQIGEAKAGIGVARAHLRQAEAGMRKSTRDRVRYEQLYAEKVIAAENLDDARSSEEVARTAVEAAREQVVRAEQTLNRARATGTTVALRSKTAEAVAGRLQEALTAVELARARMQTEEANLALARANLQDTRVVAPFDGTVLERLVEAGEVIAPGSPIVTFMDMTKPYVKVYVAERDIAKVKLGDEARIYTDGFPDRYAEADVARVSQQAEFTPRDIYMPDERTKLVFAVKLAIRDSEGIFKPGMPVDARIRWQAGSPWEDGMD
jgi:membrane fusion protein YbhG